MTDSEHLRDDLAKYWEGFQRDVGLKALDTLIEAMGPELAKKVKDDLDWIRNRLNEIK